MRNLSRDEIIEDLRRALVAMSSDEHSICHIAKERGLFCHGFAKWKFSDLKKRYPQITRSRPHLTPKELDDLADRWQMARQFVSDEPLACDVQMHEGTRQTCRGWDEFSDEELVEFHRDLCDEEVSIIRD